jgi:hypothetical protein
MSTGFERHSPPHDPLPWVLIALALVVAVVIFIQAL